MIARRPLLFAPLLSAPPALAQTAAARFPDRPIRIVVPFAAGGNSDTLARIIGPKLRDALGQPIVIENRPGGGGTIAAGVVAQAPADGHTLLFDSFSFVVTPLLVRSPGVDYERGFVPVAAVVTAPYVFAVRRGFPATTIPLLVEYVKRQPGLPYGTPGAGTVGHLAGVLLAQRADIRLEHLPYRGGADVARDLAAGTLDLAAITASSLRPLAEDGRAIGIALTSAERRGSMARLPTVAEGGYPGFDLTSWNGLFVPAATPPAVVAQLDAAVRGALADPETQSRIAPTGNDPFYLNSAAFAERIMTDREVVRRIVAETGMRAD